MSAGDGGPPSQRKMSKSLDHSKTIVQYRNFWLVWTFARQMICAGKEPITDSTVVFMSSFSVSVIQVTGLVLSIQRCG